MTVRRVAARALVVVSMVCAVLSMAVEPAAAAGTMSVSDAAVIEGDSGSSTLQFTVTLSVSNLLPVTADYQTSDGTAVAGSDYTATSGTVTFIPGATTVAINVPVTPDSFPEPNETLTVTLSNPSSGTGISDDTGVGTITNDDGPAPTLSVNDITTTETDAPTSASFIVSLPAPAAQTTTVGYATSGGTASSGTDFGSTSGTATIAAGQSSTTVPVAIVGDNIDEPDETFTLTLSNPMNATIQDGSGSGTIVDDDAAPNLQSDAPSAAETSGSTSLVFAVTLDSPSGRTVSVDYATSNGTATAGSDYTAASGTLIFAAGDVSETVTVPVTGDAVNEPDETVILTLSSAVNAAIPQPTATGTILNDDPQPLLSVADVTFTEGNSGTASASLAVTLSAASGQPVTVDIATTGAGTATAATDYHVTSEGLTFPAGTTSRTFSVPVVGDVLDEDNETVSIELTNAVGAGIGDGSATLTIADNDAMPSLSLSDASVMEGNSGTAPVSLTLTLSAPSGRDVSVDVSDSSGSAVAGADYAPQSGTNIDIPAGSTTATVAASVFGDLIDEANETFTLNLSGATNAAIGDGAGLITILDDDSGPSISIGDASELEGTGLPTTDTILTFTVTLSAASEQTATVAYATADSTASAGLTDDYDAASGTLTFAPGDTSETLTVNVNRDSHAEPSEAFLVNLSSPTNAVLSTDATGVGTIQNDDGPPPSVSVADVVVPEAAGLATVTVTLSSPATQDVAVNMASSNGSAVSPGDYEAFSTTVTIQAGQTSQTTGVIIADDSIDEPNEVFNVTLSNASNAVINDGSATVTITDDDAVPSLSVADGSVSEGVAASVTVSLSNPSSQTIVVHAASADGTASAADYAAVSVDVTFDPGETSKQVALDTTEDVIDEPDETVVVTLSDPSAGATIADGTGVLTITDDDDVPTLGVADGSVSEGVAASVTVSLSNPSSQTVTVHAATSDGTASAADYTAVSVDVTFAAGETSKQLAVSTLEDDIDEPDETVTVTLSDPSAGATIADGTGVLTINDDDATPAFSVADTAVAEGASGGVTVSLSGPSSQTVTVHAATSDGTASAADYTAVSVDVTFAAGETSKQLAVST
ncbi:MAG: beta strand repeat-containing protein, partial [Actinomycetota bacterium]